MFPYVKWTLISVFTALLGIATTPALADADVIFSGGGMIADGRGPEAKKITFSVNLFADSGGTSLGQLQFHFHNLDDSYGLDRSQFKATEFEDLLIETRYFEETPYTFVKISAQGELNGAEDWSVVIRFADFGTPASNKALPPNHADAVRIQLFDPTPVLVYDTGWEQENWREQSRRALLDGGNVTVDMRLVPSP